MKSNRWGSKDLGVGIGLRSPHFSEILENPPEVDFFEILTENYLDTNGYAAHVLDFVAERYPVVMHGVSMSIGSTDPIDFDYLAKVKALGEKTGARWLSDHLCWTGVNNKNTHDLLPLPYTEEILTHVVERIKTIQDFLGRPVAFENPSTYLEFAHSSMTEWEFLGRMAEEADCGILFDVNNVYVSAFNHSFDPLAYIDAVPADRVFQYHLAGYTDMGTHLLDTHSDHVVDPVWELFGHTLGKIGSRATLIEWDASIPDLGVLLAESEKARSWKEKEASNAA